MFLHIHKEVTDDLDLKDVATKFINKLTCNIFQI